MVFIPAYAQIRSPDPANPQDLATKNYVDNSVMTAPFPPGTVIKQQMMQYNGGWSLTGPQTNHGWYSMNFVKIRPDTTLNVYLTGSTYVSVAGGAYSFPIQVGSSGIVACAVFGFNAVGTHQSWSGWVFNAGGVGLTGAVVVTTYINFAETGTQSADGGDRSTLTVYEVMPG